MAGPDRYIRWTDEQILELHYMARIERVPWEKIADHFGRTENAVKAKLAVYEGRRWTHERRSPRSHIPYARPEWGEPPPRTTIDHLKHCLAVLRANSGCGFPAYDLPPMARIAA